MEQRFNSDGFETFKHLESLILLAAKRLDYEESLNFVLNFYGDDFDEEMLKTQLVAFGHTFPEKNNITFEDILKYFKEEPGTRIMFSQIVILIELILVAPASNASSERYFSALKRLKTYMSSTMGQGRLNHLMVSSVYKNEMNELDLRKILNEFVDANDVRRNRYGTFIETDFS